jgi:hypothetical protein
MNNCPLSVSVLTVQLLDGDLAMRNIFASKKHRAEAAFTQLTLEPVNIVEELGHDFGITTCLFGYGKPLSL